MVEFYIFFVCFVSFFIGYDFGFGLAKKVAEDYIRHNYDNSFTGF